MAANRNIDDYRKVLAVEGYSDLLFYAEMLEHLRKHDEVFIQHFNGAQDLHAKLETFLSPGLLSQKESIAVVVDADSDAQARKQSVENALFNATGHQLFHGVWLAGPPRLGFYVVPDGTGAGEVETLVWHAWSGDLNNAPASQCIESYLDCMSSLGFQPESLDKGRISALLSVKCDEDPRLGPGARRKVFGFDRPEYRPLLRFLEDL